MNVARELSKKDQQKLHIFLSSYVLKMKGNKSGPNDKLSENFISATGGLIAMSIISIIAVALGFPMVLGPIGASCLLVFVTHASPFAQPRHILGGHIISTLAALTIWDFFGKNYVTIGITLAVVIFLMLLSNMVHPPAAASAIVAINSEAGWGFLWALVISVLVLIAISVIYNNIFKTRHYPTQWL